MMSQKQVTSEEKPKLKQHKTMYSRQLELPVEDEEIKRSDSDSLRT